MKIDNIEQKYPADKVHELPERFVALPKHWIEHIDKLKHWNDTLWTQNSCVIPAYEACEWQDSLETYSILAIAVAVEYYKLDFDDLFQQVVLLLESQDIDKDIKLPSDLFPKNKKKYNNLPSM